MRISVWDDNTEFAREWSSGIEEIVGDSSVVVEAPDNGQIEQELKLLHERRKSYLDSQKGEIIGEDSLLDSTDILLVDNDLFEIRNFGDYSAEMVAARARVYTKCKFIVVVNLTLDVDFDLSLLGHLDSKADLHINGRFVNDKGLWLECPKEDGAFRPWHWPLIPLAAKYCELRVAELIGLFERGANDTPILEYFGFDSSTRNRLSRSARAFLHPERSADSLTFASFIDCNRNAVDVRDGEKIVEKGDNEKIARICAHRISKWLSHLILGPQDILIDLPHLVQKLPFLVPEEQSDVVSFWNSYANLGDGPIAKLTQEVSEYRFQLKHWFDRPVFWWNRFDTDENLANLLGAVDANPEELVFCEDSSAFHSSRECHRFVAAHHSISDDRFVRWPHQQELKYGPQSRLAR